MDASRSTSAKTDLFFARCEVLSLCLTSAEAECGVRFFDLVGVDRSYDCLLLVGAEAYGSMEPLEQKSTI